jgi:hypothetical protein
MLKFGLLSQSCSGCRYWYPRSNRLHNDVAVIIEGPHIVKIATPLKGAGDATKARDPVPKTELVRRCMQGQKESYRQLQAKEIAA